MPLTGIRSQLCVSQAQKALRLLGDQSAKVPIDVDHLASLLGYQIVLLQSVDDACSAIVSTKDKLIGINAGHHRHRRRFSVGHEIGHILLKHPPESRCTSREIALFNIEADECAAEILMPRLVLAEYLSRSRNIVALAHLFDVSEEAMRMRFKRIQQ